MHGPVTRTGCRDADPDDAMAARGKRIDNGADDVLIAQKTYAQAADEKTRTEAMTSRA
jgi:hypothetical protein